VRPILIPSIQVPAGKFNTYWSSYPSAGSAFFKTLDSNLKKNTAFIKKVTKVGEETKEKLCAEMQTLNLSRYVSEVVAAIADAKLKNTDVGAVVQVCIHGTNTNCFFNTFVGLFADASKILGISRIAYPCNHSRV